MSVVANWPTVMSKLVDPRGVAGNTMDCDLQVMLTNGGINSDDIRIEEFSGCQKALCHDSPTPY
jgi:hypothetical protein